MILIDPTIPATAVASQGFLIYVAAATLENPGPFKDAESSFAWLVADGGGKELCRGPSALRQSRIMGDHTKALFPALLVALDKVPDGCHVEVRSDVKHFVDLLNGSAEARRKACYRRKDRRPLADAENLRELDDVLEARHIAISARYVPDDDKDHHMSWVKSWASEVARNLHSDASSWNL